VSGQVPPRRRRIAGERRSATPATPAAPVSETAQVEPVSLTKGREAPEAPVSPEWQHTPEPPAAPVPAQEPAGRDVRSGWWGSRGSLVVLTVTLVALLVVTGLGLAGLLGNRGLVEIREASDVRDAEQTAPSVAERATEGILAYDYKTLDVDQDAAERFMTPAFAKKYAASFTKAVAPAARTYKAQVTAKVLGTSVVRATQDRVRVLVFVDQTTVATNKKNPQVALNRVELDMVLRGGSWLVDDITSY
jgi:Mce-associated membrane protein